MNDLLYIAIIAALVIAFILQEYRSSRSESSRGRSQEPGEINRKRTLPRDEAFRYLDLLPEAMVLINESGKIIHANSKARSIFGLKILEGKRLPQIMELPEKMIEALSQPGGNDKSFEVKTAKRVVRLSIIASSPSRSGHRREERIIVIEDITRERQLEKRRRDLISNASHELKTPLSRMGLLVSSLRTSLAEKDGLDAMYVEKIEREVLGLQAIISDLLDLSRIEDDARTQLRSVIDLKKVITRTIEEFMSEAADKNISLEHLQFETDSSDAQADIDRYEINGNEADILLMVKNLADNAIAHSRTGGKVSFSLERTTAKHRNAQLILLKVIDQGMGIPSADLTRIFERFYRVDKGRSSRPQSTGIGLAIVKHVVQNHRGRIEVASQLGQGSTFSVFLPAASDSGEKKSKNNSPVSGK